MSPPLDSIQINRSITPPPVVCQYYSFCHQRSNHFTMPVRTSRMWFPYKNFYPKLFLLVWFFLHDQLSISHWQATLAYLKNLQDRPKMRIAIPTTVSLPQGIVLRNSQF